MVDTTDDARAARRFGRAAQLSGLVGPMPRVAPAPLEQALPKLAVATNLGNRSFSQVFSPEAFQPPSKRSPQELQTLADIQAGMPGGFTIQDVRDLGLTPADLANLPAATTPQQRLDRATERMSLTPREQELLQSSISAPSAQPAQPSQQPAQPSQLPEGARPVSSTRPEANARPTFQFPKSQAERITRKQLVEAIASLPTRAAQTEFIAAVDARRAPPDPKKVAQNQALMMIAQYNEMANDPSASEAKRNAYRQASLNLLRELLGVNVDEFEERLARSTLSGG